MTRKNEQSDLVTYSERPQARPSPGDKANLQQRASDAQQVRFILGASSAEPEPRTAPHTTNIESGHEEAPTATADLALSGCQRESRHQNTRRQISANINTSSTQIAVSSRSGGRRGALVWVRAC